MSDTSTSKTARESFRASIEREINSGRHLPLDYRTLAGREQFHRRIAEFALVAKVQLAGPKCYAAREALVVIAAAAWRAARELGIEDELPFGAEGARDA